MARIAVVGATGPTGVLVVDEALRRGHEVVAYIRRPEAMRQQERLTIVGGELEDAHKFVDAIRGSDVLICTLGTRSRRERDFMSRHLPLVTSAMQAAGVPRLVLMSALGGGELPKKATGINRLVFAFLSKVVFADRTRSEAALAGAGLPWSAAYPGFLTDAPRLSAIDVVEIDAIKGARGERIPRADVAAVLLELAEQKDGHERRVVVAPAGTVARA